MVLKIINAAIVVALSCVAYAEGYVENIVLYNDDDGLVTVCYDLLSAEPKRITLVGKANGFDLEIDSVSGDVGVMITAGVDKCIFWESRDDYPEGFKNYSVSLDIVVSDYEPIGSAEETVGGDAPGQSAAVPHRGRKKALSEAEMLRIIDEHADETKKSRKKCDKSRTRLEKAKEGSSKTRADRLGVEMEYDCREFSVLKRQLIDYVQAYEDRTGSQKAKKYLRVLE